MAGFKLWVFAWIFCSVYLLRPMALQECGQGITQQVCFSQKCPELHPLPCKDVVSNDPRVVMNLWYGMEVMCDTQTDGGGWLVIQRRVSGQLDFYRNWTEYKHGFGDIGDEFWFGNEKVFRLTRHARYELRVDLTYNGNEYYAKYSHFGLSGEADSYKLEVTGYSGNAGDSLGYHNDRPFSTKDRDNDDYPTSCAEKFHGAWWYGECHDSHLNGLWGSVEYAKGLIWLATTTYYGSADFTEMKIRLVD